ncbi:hypothetical protein [Actinomycetospora cinnamomea]|uniref:Uncharacterized protein n=1 Tax=Actinomycetospora cinnamomea TaxID=663609 RepID=A0A2U1F4K3_9PSEU|nr:hypothetical protein [Actinomycetospora cinnamomea]PVZ06960.1 hypothetical protein C8D89_112153 [Actinomycetospora cinnamomea]
MLCVLATPGRYNGGVDRPPGPDGGPPPEVEVVAARRHKRTDPEVGDVYDVDVVVYRRDGSTADGEPRYVRDRAYTEERTG